jgi:hypothetical protein
VGWFSRDDDTLLEDIQEIIQQETGKLRDEIDIRLQSGTKTPPPSQVQKAIRSFRRQSPAPLSYRHSSGFLGDGEFQGPVHNFIEIAKAIDIESLFARAVQRHRELCMKGGWRLRGRDSQRVKYVTRRLHEISLVSDTTFGQVLRETFYNLITYSNHMGIIKRDPQRSSGGNTRLYGRTHEPISGFYGADPTSMSVKQSKSGLIERWRQKIFNSSRLGREAKNKREWPARDVIHLVLDRRSGFIFGTPYVIPVLEDMRLLRRLEELVDIIAHKHAFPMLVVKVGTDEKPADEVLVGGRLVPEVEIAQAQVENMDFEAGWVVTERYNVEFVGSDNATIDLNPYLEYLEKRVLGGLRLSDIDLGRGDSANRNTAQTITQNLIDACTEIQKVVEETYTWKLIFPILMEGGFTVNLANPEEDMVYLDFPPIDTEEQRKQEVHAMEQYQANLVTETEARVMSGRKPFTDADREDLMLNRVTKPTSDYDAKAKAAVAASKATTTSKSRPTNQHGTKVKPKVSKNKRESFASAYLDQVDYHYQEACAEFISGVDLRPGEDPYMAEGWKDNRPRRAAAMNTQAGFQGARLVNRFKAAEAGILMDARTFLSPLMTLGFEHAVGGQEVDRNYIQRDEVELFFRYQVRDQVKNLLRAGTKVLKYWDSRGRHPDERTLRSALEVHGFGLADGAIHQAKLAYAFGYLKGAEATGAEAILVQRSEDSTGECSCQEKILGLPLDPQALVCHRSGCRMEYSITDKDRLHV